MGARILLGEVRARLRQLPSDSVHCCVTSPPYYGLRSYHTSPVAWGGNDEACDHQWTEPVRRAGGSGRQGATSPRATRANVEAQELVRDMGTFCSRCWAWLGPAAWLKRRARLLAKWEKAIRPLVQKAVYCRVEPCTVLDPFSGSGTTCLVADRLGRRSIGIELNPDFARMALRRLQGESSLFAPTEIEE